MLEIDRGQFVTRRRGDHCAIEATVASFLVLPSSVTSARVRGSSRRRGGKGGDVVRREQTFFVVAGMESAVERGSRCVRKFAPRRW
jgi:hypothetical protein